VEEETRTVRVRASEWLAEDDSPSDGG